MCRPAVKMAAMMPPAEMMAVTSATMAAAVMAAPMMTAPMMTAAATTAVAAAMTAFRDCKIRYRQRRCEHKGGNSHCDP